MELPDATIERDEADLLALLRAGRPEGYERLVRGHLDRLLAVARRLLGNEEDARDAVQDAFLSVVKSIGQFSGESRLSTWLHRIVINASLMKLRTRKRRNERSIEDLLPAFQSDGHASLSPADWNAAPESMAERREVRDLVRQLIDELPLTHREVLLLRDIEELDTEATAETLGISVAAVKTRLHRARQALRELLDPHLRRGAL